MSLRPADAVYDPNLNVATPNQEEAAKAVFELIQALRQEASQQDPDSPGELTPVEIFQAAISRVPGAAMAIMELVNDDQAIGDDVLEVSHILINQLGVAG